MISKYEGNNEEARKNIGEYLKDIGYLVPGACPSGYYPYDLNGDIKICNLNYKIGNKVLFNNLNLTIKKSNKSSR